MVTVKRKGRREKLGRGEKEKIERERGKVERS